jgi:hypothetical protein
MRKNFNLKSSIKKLLKHFNLEIMSSTRFDSITMQRDEAIKILTLDHPLNPDLSCIIFSKDRALQLHGLIESIDKNCIGIKSVYVIYTCSSTDHFLSYEELIEGLNNKLNIEFVREKESFQDTVRNLLMNINTEKLMFLVDDNIFIHPIDFQVINKFENVISLRLGDGINYSYTANEKISQPKLKVTKQSELYSEFAWSQGQGEWGDPCSLDGGIYSTRLIRCISNLYDFIGPNSYEAGFKLFDTIFLKQMGVCPRMPVLKNIALNRVQSEYKNRHGEESAEDLLQKWRSGLKIDISQLMGIRTRSTHTIIEMKYIVR